MKKLYILTALGLFNLNAKAQCGVNPVPIADFSFTSGCGLQSIYFNDSSTISSGSIVSWMWDFGDGSPLNNSQNPSYQYNGEGSYTVKLLVTSNLGCKDSISKTCNVYPNPTVYFTADETVGCGLLCASFTDLSQISTGSIIQWEWTFGDGTTSFTQNPNYCYTNGAGPYNVMLTVTSNNGCVATSNMPLTITVYPSVAYTTTYDTLQNEFTIMVDSLTTNNALSYEWDFGDGTSSSLNTPTHIYTVDSVYNICMKIYLPNGASCTYCDSIGIDSLGNIIRNPGFKVNVTNANSVSGIYQTLSVDNDFAIFPNPTSGVFQVTNTNNQILNIEVYNVLGAFIHRQVGAFSNPQIDLSNQPNNIYFLKIKTKKGTISKKVIINN